MTLDPNEDSQVMVKRKGLKRAAPLETPPEKIQKGMQKTPETTVGSTTPPSSNESEKTPSSSEGSKPGEVAKKLFNESDKPAPAPKDSQGPNRDTQAKDGKAAAVKGAAKPKVQPPQRVPAPKAPPAEPVPPSSTCPAAPKHEKVKRSPSLGVQSLLNRSQTQESVASPCPPTPRVEPPELTENPGADESEPAKKKRKRDKAAHARRNRFYRTLDSRGLSLPKLLDICDMNLKI